MDKIGQIEIRVLGHLGDNELSPDNFDIKYIAALIQNIEDLLYPTKKKDRPLITYDLKEGSVRHLFKTPIQYIIGLNAVLAQVQESQSIDFLELKTAHAFERIQELAKQKDFKFEFSTSIENKVLLNIDAQTKFYRTSNLWAESEFYFYGILKDAGGKSSANIHLDTDDFGYLRIEAAQDFLMKQKENLLYKKFGVRVKGMQNIESGEIDTKTLKLIELINYNPSYDNDYLSTLILKAKNKWKGIDPDNWLNKIRGYEG